ncbi:thioredoxin domain-containing protein [Naegleria gruberi]|uniref:Thioredoxin domain-containing protein n=1 Tax=Naegleria gruberi TaxID=5762 RepID=D2VNQ5_NAEGR|nr:thioredoxin domain-containing protein [Naegleria gruberi]EFC41450.1 thioredoxin domain-containing protein [Naegleria gruberi]|eukprot:XP_002674194.1 thioredoxin domain-containing protein [Naegleria gruberi strain NEG-M]
MTPSAVSSSSCFKTFSTSMRTLADETVEAQHVSERSDVIIEADENFRAFIDSGEPIIVDFYADWCGPCKQLGPLLEKHTLKHNGAFKLIKVNVDNQPQIAEAFRVQDIPHVLFIMDKQLVDQFKGAIPADHVEKTLENFANVARNRAANQSGQSNEEQPPQVDADSPEYLISIAGQLMAKGELEEASKVYSQVVEKAVDKEMPDYAAKGLAGLLTISIAQYKMDAAKSIISRLNKDHGELIKTDKEIVAAISLYECYKEAGEQVVKAIHEGKTINEIQGNKERVLYLYLTGQQKEALEAGIALLKKSDTKNEGRTALVHILNCLENQEANKKLVSDTRKRMASLLF